MEPTVDINSCNGLKITVASKIYFDYFDGVTITNMKIDVMFSYSLPFLNPGLKFHPRTFDKISYTAKISSSYFLIHHSIESHICRTTKALF